MVFSRRLRRLLARIFRLRPLAIAGGAAFAVACVSPMTPAAKLNESVQELNYAARFGRVDMTMDHVAAAARALFLKHHASWGGDVRIVDVELGGLERMTKEEAVVLVGYSWFRPNEGELRTTTVRQTWKTDGGKGDWTLVDEARAGGDVGLLGEQPVVVLKPEHKDRHFETKVISGN
jgi:hypothetical protein